MCGALWSEFPWTILLKHDVFSDCNHISWKENMTKIQESGPYCSSNQIPAWSYEGGVKVKEETA